MAAGVDAVFVDSQDAVPPHLQLEFKCFLIDHKTNKHVPVSKCSSFSPIMHRYEYFSRLSNVFSLVLAVAERPAN